MTYLGMYVEYASYFPPHCHLFSGKLGVMLNHTVGWRASLQAVLHTEGLHDRWK